MKSDRQQYRNRHIAALDLVEAWMHDADADVCNIADGLAQEPRAACYALTRIIDTALQAWADAVNIDQDDAFAMLRAGDRKAIVDSQYTSHVDVFLYLHNGDQVLLALRRNTGYADEMWNLPSGKLEAGEHVLDAVLREAREEIEVALDPGTVELAGMVHHRTPRQDGRIGLVFRAAYHPEAHGTPFNAEPHKCGGIAWYPHDALPENTVACVKLVQQESPLVLHGCALELRNSCRTRSSNLPGVPTPEEGSSSV